MPKAHRTPKQIRQEANTQWPGDGQRVAARGVTVEEWQAHLEDKAEADARRDFSNLFATALHVDPNGFEDLSLEAEVDLLDPDAEEEFEARWGGFPDYD